MEEFLPPSLLDLTSVFRGESLEEEEVLAEEKFPAQDDNNDSLTFGSNNEEKTKDDNLRSLKNSRLEGTSQQTGPNEDEKDFDQRESEAKQFNEIKEVPSSLDDSRTIGSFIQRGFYCLQTAFGLRKGTDEKEEVKTKSPPCSVVVSSKNEVVTDTSSSKILTRLESDSLEGRYCKKLEKRLAYLENLIPQCHSRHEEDAIFKQKLQKKIDQLESQLEEDKIFKQKLQKEMNQLESQLQESDDYRENDQKTIKQAAEMAQPRKKTEKESVTQCHSQWKGMGEMEAVDQDHLQGHARLKEVDRGGEKTEKKEAKDRDSHLKDSCCSKEKMEVRIAELQSQLIKEMHLQKENTEKEIQNAKEKTDERFETIKRKVAEYILDELNYREEKKEKTMAQLHSQVKEIQGVKQMSKEIGKRIEGIEKNVAEHALQLDEMSSRGKKVEERNAELHSQLVKETNHQLEKMDGEIRDLRELMKGIFQRTEKVEKKAFDLQEMGTRVETTIGQFHSQTEELRRFLEEMVKKEMREVADEVKNQSAFLSTHEENMALLRRGLGNLNAMFQHHVNQLNWRVDTLFISNGPVVPNRLG